MAAGEQDAEPEGMLLDYDRREPRSELERNQGPCGHRPPQRATTKKLDYAENRAVSHYPFLL